MVLQKVNQAVKIGIFLCCKTKLPARLGVFQMGLSGLVLSRLTVRMQQVNLGSRRILVPGGMRLLLIVSKVDLGFPVPNTSKVSAAYYLISGKYLQISGIDQFIYLCTHQFSRKTQKKLGFRFSDIMKQGIIIFIFILLLGISSTSCSGSRYFSSSRKFEKRAFNPKRKLTKQERKEEAEINRRKKSQIRSREEIEAKRKFERGQE